MSKKQEPGEVRRAWANGVSRPPVYRKPALPTIDGSEHSVCRTLDDMSRDEIDAIERRYGMKVARPMCSQAEWDAMDPVVKATFGDKIPMVTAKEDAYWKFTPDKRGKR